MYGEIAKAMQQTRGNPDEALLAAGAANNDIYTQMFRDANQAQLGAQGGLFNQRLALQQKALRDQKKQDRRDLQFSLVGAGLGAAGEAMGGMFGGGAAQPAGLPASSPYGGYGPYGNPYARYQ